MSQRRPDLINDKDYCIAKVKKHVADLVMPFKGLWLSGSHAAALGHNDMNRGKLPTEDSDVDFIVVTDKLKVHQVFDLQMFLNGHFRVVHGIYACFQVHYKDPSNALKLLS